MAWQIRSLAEASSRIRGTFRQYIPGTDAALKNNVVTVIGKVLVVMAHEFELRLAFLASQLFLSTASGQWLVMHCRDIGIYRKQAAAAFGAAVGIAAPSTTYPAGIRLVSGNVTYISLAAATSAPDGILVLLIQSEVKGATSNREAGGLLDLADPVLWPGLGREWVVGGAGFGGGADIETDESLRERGLQRKRNPPGGGTLTDYERIVRSVPGVLKAWAFRVPDAPGAIVVHFLFEGRVDFIPTPADVSAVQAVVDAQRLVRVDDSVVTASVPRPINVEIHGLAGDSGEIRAAISAAIRSMFLDRCRPGIAGDMFSVSRSWIAEAISGVVGEDRHQLIQPAADILLTDGQFPTLGAVTYGA